MVTVVLEKNWGDPLGEQRTSRLPNKYCYNLPFAYLYDCSSLSSSEKFPVNTKLGHCDSLLICSLKSWSLFAFLSIYSRWILTKKAPFLQVRPSDRPSSCFTCLGIQSLTYLQHLDSMGCQWLCASISDIPQLRILWFLKLSGHHEWFQSPHDCKS